MAQAHGDEYEQQHVHSVYEQIASHFSATRFKPWPIIERFLLSLPTHSIGLDIGCGNGKYLTINPKIYILASDHSTNLARIASKHPPHDVVVADILSLPHKGNTFDFAICIAVIHHLSTNARRIDAIKAILEQMASHGKALIYVWALEQKSSRRGWDEGDAQDVMVPWVLKSQDQSHVTDSTGPIHEQHTNEDKTFHRYYHLYRKGELESDIVAAGGRVLEAGYEKDNWWAIAALKCQEV